MKWHVYIPTENSSVKPSLSTPKFYLDGKINPRSSLKFWSLVISSEPTLAIELVQGSDGDLETFSFVSGIAALFESPGIGKHVLEKQLNHQ